MKPSALCQFVANVCRDRSTATNKEVFIDRGTAMKFRIVLGVALLTFGCLTSPQVADVDMSEPDATIEPGFDWTEVFDPWGFESGNGTFVSQSGRSAFASVSTSVSLTDSFKIEGTSSLALPQGTHLTLGEDSTIELNDDFLVGGWFRPTSVIQSQFFVFEQDDGDGRTISRTNDGKIKCAQKGGENQIEVVGTFVALNDEFTHVVCEFTADRIRVFVNGIGEGVVNSNFEPLPTSNAAIIGSPALADAAADKFGGQVDEFFFIETEDLPTGTDLNKRLAWIYACGMDGSRCDCEEGKTLPNDDFPIEPASLPSCP